MTFKTNIKEIYKKTPANKFWNPLYWLQVLISWPLPTRYMNKFFSQEKIYCMFDNMNTSRRLVINARCVPDAGFLWLRNPGFTKLRLGRVFGKVSGTFMNEIFIHYNGEEVMLNMVDGTYKITKENKLIDRNSVWDMSVKPIEYSIQKFDGEIDPKLPDISNGGIQLTLGDWGDIMFMTIDRGIHLHFSKEYLSKITEESTRGALISEKRVVKIKSVDTILDI